MREFGERLGMAFQLADDLIDIASEADETGKTPGTDLREGKRTLPVLHVLASADPADARLKTLLVGDLSDGRAARAEALGLLRAHPAMDRAREHTLAVAPRAPVGARRAAAERGQGRAARPGHRRRHPRRLTAPRPTRAPRGPCPTTVAVPSPTRVGLWTTSPMP